MTNTERQTVIQELESLKAMISAEASNETFAIMRSSQFFLGREWAYDAVSDIINERIKELKDPK